MLELAVGFFCGIATSLTGFTFLCVIWPKPMRSWLWPKDQYSFLHGTIYRKGQEPTDASI